MLPVITLLLLLVPACRPRCLPSCNPLHCNTTSLDYSCEQCQPGYFLSSTTCLPCPQQCLTCTSQNTCLQCQQYGVSLRASTPGVLGTCMQCDPQCRICVNVPGNCSACVLGYELVVNTVTKIGECRYPTTVTILCEGIEQLFVQNYKEASLSTSADVPLIKYCALCQLGYYAWMGQCNECPGRATRCEVDKRKLFQELVLVAFTVGDVVQIQEKSDEISLLGLSQSIIERNSFQLFSDWHLDSWIELGLILEEAENRFQRMDQAFLNYSFYYYQAREKTLLQNFTARLTPDSRAELYNSLATPSTEFNVSQVTQLIREKLEAKLNLSCLQGEVLESRTQQCKKCPMRCQVCDAENPLLCLSCIDKFVYHAQMNLCVPCHHSCLTCNAGNSAINCTSCPSGYYFMSANSSCLQRPECLTFTLSAQTPTPRLLCSTCSLPQSLYPSPSSSICYACGDPGCRDCLSTNTSFCLQCLPGYTLNSSQCLPCTSNCLACRLDASASHDQHVQTRKTISLICTQCDAAYVLISNFCVECAQYCVRCSPRNTSLCYECAEGAVMKVNGRCEKCADGCRSCTAGGVCKIWEAGYGAKGKCRAQNCERCQEVALCEGCLQGYWLDDSSFTCRKCGYMCQFCTSAQNCLKCEPRYRLIGTKCQPECLNNCITCQGSYNITLRQACTSCPSGTYLSPDKTCPSCPSACLTCSDSLTCTSCRYGYILRLNFACSRCMSTCNGQCDTTNISKCLSCAPGFQLREGVCVSCGIGCVDCIEGRCVACSGRYFLDANASVGAVLGRCVKKCAFPCKECDGEGCQGCVEGYDMINGTCMINLTCVGLGSACACPRGSLRVFSQQPQPLSTDYYTCAPCPENCSLCTEPPTTTCLTCLQGHYFNITCTRCPTQCQECLNSTLCLSCSTGYLLQSTTCLKCATGCTSCQMTINTCYSCESNYLLQKNKCIGLYTLDFGFTFAQVLEQFVAAGKLDNFVNKLATILTVAEQDIVITELSSGSTNINGIASARSSTHASSLSSTLSTILTASPNIFGSAFSRSSFRVNLNGQPVPSIDQITQQSINNSSQPNLPVIIGSSVGGTIVLMLVVICLCYYCRGRKGIRVFTLKELYFERLYLVDDSGRLRGHVGNPYMGKE